MARRDARHREVVISILELLGWLDIEATETDASRVWNERGEVRASRVQKGWPDITFVLPDGRAAFFEVKVGRDTLSLDQAYTHSRLERAGARIAVPHSIDDAASALLDWLPDGPMRTRLEGWFPKPKPERRPK